MAEKVFDCMVGDGVALNTVIYTTMIKGYSKAFNLAEAIAIYRQMKEDPDQRVFPNNVTYNSLLDCCVRCFDMGTASKIFDEMQAGGCVKSSKSGKKEHE